MELNPLGARSAPLISGTSAECGGGRRPRCSSGEDRGLEEPLDAVVERPSGRDAMVALAAAAGALVLGMVLLYVLVQEWRLQTTYRTWLLLAFIAPITFVYKFVWSHSSHVLEQRGWIRVEVDSMRSPPLFNALAQQIENAAEGNAATCSSDVEAYTEYDKPTGCTQVRMRFWGSRSRLVRLRLLQGQLCRELAVRYERGGDVVCGREQSVKNRERFVMHLAASQDRLGDKELLRRWLHFCVERYREPPRDVVEVIALDQSSTDWVPEWKTRCVRPMRRSDGVGHGFFLKRPSITPLLADACTWCGKELRVYLIVGPAGTGKTELTIWLAGHLKVPLYRISLNDPRLTDQLFAQLVSPTSLRHDNALIQIDEFQETLHRWKRADGYQSKGVSVGGFCEVLQGSNSLARGFIVLSGTQELAETMRDPAFAAVFRRIAVTTALDWLSAEDLQLFFCRFIADFVPGCPTEELHCRSADFVRQDGPWGGLHGHRISIDMVKQFLMLRISSFRADVLPDGVIGPDIPFRVSPEHHRRFLDHVCDLGAAREHLSAYPPVAATSWLAVASLNGYGAATAGTAQGLQ